MLMIIISLTITTLFLYFLLIYPGRNREDDCCGCCGSYHIRAYRPDSDLGSNAVLPFNDAESCENRARKRATFMVDNSDLTLDVASDESSTYEMPYICICYPRDCKCLDNIDSKYIDGSETVYACDSSGKILDLTLTRGDASGELTYAITGNRHVFEPPTSKDVGYYVIGCKRLVTGREILAVPKVGGDEGDGM